MSQAPANQHKLLQLIRSHSQAIKKLPQYNSSTQPQLNNYIQHNLLSQNQTQQISPIYTDIITLIDSQCKTPINAVTYAVRTNILNYTCQINDKTIYTLIVQKFVQEHGKRSTNCQINKINFMDSHLYWCIKNEKRITNIMEYIQILIDKGYDINRRINQSQEILCSTGMCCCCTQIIVNFTPIDVAILQENYAIAYMIYNAQGFATTLRSHEQYEQCSRMIGMTKNADYAMMIKGLKEKVKPQQMKFNYIELSCFTSILWSCFSGWDKCLKYIC